MAHTRSTRAFTLIELLVVISIIIFATAITVPAVSKFTRGASLANSGRLMQSLINEARRTAITNRRGHYIICYHTLDSKNQERFGFRIFQEGFFDGEGYLSSEFVAPNAVVLQTQPSSVQGLFGVAAEPQSNLPPNVEVGGIESGCRLAVFDELPYPGQGVYAAAGKDPVTTPDWQSSPARYTEFFTFPELTVVAPRQGYSMLRFNRDGTAEFQYDNNSAFAAFMTAGPGGVRKHRLYDINDGPSLYDRNINFPETDLTEQGIRADFTFRQQGEPKKRCFVDIDANTGRCLFRVCQLNGYSGAGGIGTQVN